MDKFNFPAVILAGGKSSRMETDKSLLPFGEFSSLTLYQYYNLKQFFKNVYISSKNDKFDFLKDKTKLLLDNNNLSSPMIALQSIFQTIHSEYVFIIAVDIPLVQPKTIQILYENFLSSSADIVIAKDHLGNIHNLCGIFRKTLLNTIGDLLTQDIHKISFLIQNSKYHEVLIEDDEQFLNLNDKEQYQLACKLLKNYSNEE